MNSKPVEEKHRIALVQGESFRCVAVEADRGRWRKVHEKTELPRVLEVVAVIGYCNSLFF
jgi:hypothetical protein